MPTPRSWWVSWAALLLGAAGCGGDDGSICDACAEAPDGTVALEGVDIPWLADGTPPVAPPDLTPCPDGWREVAPTSEGDPTTCDPYRRPGPDDCPVHQAHFPGEPGCTTVGSACPAGDFAAGLPSDGTVVYVRPGSTGGDGSSALPYGSVTEFSVNALPMGSVIALSRGTHTGPVRLTRGHELVGACAESTRVQAAAAAEAEGVVTLIGAGGALRDLTLFESPRPGLWIQGVGITGLLDGVVVAQTRGFGVAVRGGSLDAHELVVRETSALGDGELGRGLTVELGASVDVGRAAFSRNREAGVIAFGDGSAVTLVDVVVRETMSRMRDGLTGRAVSAVDAAVLEVRRGALLHNHEGGLITFGGVARLERVVARDTRGQEGDRMFGRGVNAQTGAVVHIERTELTRNRGSGIHVSEESTEATIADVVVRDTGSDELDGTNGRGLTVQRGAVATATRVHLARNREVGVVVAGVVDAAVDTSLTLSDVRVSSTRSRESDDRGGRGLVVQGTSTAEVERALIDGNRENGVFAVLADAALFATDVAVRDTESQALDGTFGRGVSLQLGATVQATRFLASRSREGGIVALSGARATFVDTAVSQVVPRACAETSCIGLGAGSGVGAFDADTVVRLSQFLVQGAELCGLHVGPGAALELDRGEVRDSQIGACIQDPDYDIAGFTTNVRFEDNGVNLQSTTLPIPEPIEVAHVSGP